MTMNKIVFPSYEQVLAMNKREYKGWEFKYNLAENLYLVIECQNESIIFPDRGKDWIMFKFCTHNYFPIASVTYANCEQGYYQGIKYLIDTAKVFIDAFTNFLETSKLVE